jgi:KaiC/GvpD/RAD55 family RecA-like ATPase
MGRLPRDKREDFIYEDNPESVDVWVCCDWFPVGTYSKTIAGFPMNRILKQQLDYMLKNVVHDWDFTLLICGEGEVRIGKSTLAQQISTYWTWSIYHLLGITLPHSVKENMVFVGSELIRQGNKLGRKQQYSSIIFDEAGADLEGVKVMQKTTQAVKDYLRECGQYNMLNILVLPEFFDLPRSVAISRSIAMINVYWVPTETGYFQRGHFKFYNKPAKKKLYINGKKDLDYSVSPETFFGNFPQFYTYDEKEYKEQKRNALKNREVVGIRERRQMEVLYALIQLVRDKVGLSLETMAQEINKRTFEIKISTMFLSRYIKKMVNTFGDKQMDEWELTTEIGEEDEKDI